MRFFIGLILILLALSGARAQKFTINGFVKDEAGEALIGASIISNSKEGTAANNNGFFSLTIPKDSISLTFSYIGYETSQFSFYLKGDTSMIIYLKGGSQLQEVQINAARADDIHESTRMGTVTIPIEQIKGLPAFAGETDILKVLQLIPGVQSGNEGTTGLYVRGGGPDQNLMLLDGAPVYNAAHLFGFFSVFNADAINHVELTKGGFPARYGGRLSAVVDINMKEGNMKEIKGEGSIGLISAKATVGGPIKKDKTSFIVSARRSYIDLLLSPLIKQSSGSSTGYYMFDFNLKMNHIINSRNRIYFSTYFGDDKAYSKTKDYYVDKNNAKVYHVSSYGLKWGNAVASLRWNHIFGQKLFSNFTGTFSNYNFKLEQSYEQKAPYLYFGTRYRSGIRDWTVKADFDYYPSPRHSIKFGTGHIYHTFTPGAYSYRTGDSLAVVADSTASRITYAYENSVYIEDDWILTKWFKMNAGIHASAFAVRDRWYHSFQPRISGRILLAKDLSLKGSYSSMTQYIHLLTNAGIGLPTDLWVPSTDRIKPQQAKQYAVGLAKTLRAEYEISLEGFHKKMSNLIEYKDGASFMDADNDWQDKVATNGDGKSYGVEFFLQKKSGVITGWVGYTLSKTTRQFETLNFGKEFPYKYDRRHDISVVFSHQWNKRMDFSTIFVYGTGNSVTLPVSNYAGSNNTLNSYSSSIGRPSPYSTTVASPVLYYGDRNSFRMRDYSRLDVSFSWWKDTRWGQSKWTISIYNLYNRKNPFYMDLGRTKQGNLAYIQNSLFPIIPSISYGFKF